MRRWQGGRKPRNIRRHNSTRNAHEPRGGEVISEEEVREGGELPFDHKKVEHSKRKIALGLQDTKSIIEVTTERLFQDIEQHPD